MCPSPTPPLVLYPLSFEMEHYTVQEGKELSVFLIIESGVARPSFFRVEVEDNEGTALGKQRVGCPRWTAVSTVG